MQATHKGLDAAPLDVGTLHEEQVERSAEGTHLVPVAAALDLLLGQPRRERAVKAGDLGSDDFGNRRLERLHDVGIVVSITDVGVVKEVVFFAMDWVGENRLLVGLEGTDAGTLMTDCSSQRREDTGGTSILDRGT